MDCVDQTFVRARLNDASGALESLTRAATEERHSLLDYHFQIRKTDLLYIYPEKSYKNRACNSGG